MPDAYVAGITEALDRLHADMPRAIVNLVVMFDISPLTNISDRLLCDAVQLQGAACFNGCVLQRCVFNTHKHIPQSV